MGIIKELWCFGGGVVMKMLLFFNIVCRSRVSCVGRLLCGLMFF